MKTTKKQRRESGTQIVELAAVLPLLLFLALAASEGAGVIRAHQVLNNAAREGARLSTVQENAGNLQFLQDSVTCYMIRNRVTPPVGQVPSYCPATAASTTTCTSYAVTINQAVLVPNGGTVMPASQVKVSCGYRLNFLPRLPWFGVSNVVNLTGQAEFRNFWTTG
jgi:Flp pilus assembly protein TadG